MYPRRTRGVLLVIITVSVLGGLLPFLSTSSTTQVTDPVAKILRPGIFRSSFRWRDLPQRYPVPELTPLPSGKTVAIPNIQFDFALSQGSHDLNERQKRLYAVRSAFRHSWEGYKRHAWLQDEVCPVSGNFSNFFGGWGATLVDSLDTLWIMGLEEEFHEAVDAISGIDFRVAHVHQLSVFETTIRFLGGLLGAYDVSGQKYPSLLLKAVELGDMLYMAFDTPNRLPVVRWDWKGTLAGHEQIASSYTSLAEIGSLSLEFTRLSQLTKDAKWYDAIARITRAFERSQNRTRVPGIWPIFVNALNGDFTREMQFTLGGLADSMYEYLPKEYLLLGGQADEYRKMFRYALEAMKRHMFYRPVQQENRDMLLPGSLTSRANLGLSTQTTSDHLGCFAGGMVALAAKAFGWPLELKTARALVEGCLWASDGMGTGIMPESFTALACKQEATDECIWNEEEWLQTVAEHTAQDRRSFKPNADAGRRIAQEERLPPGFLEINDPRYNLRPEVIESIFVLYRTTGDQRLYERAWEMFLSVEKASKTDIAYSALGDVRDTHPQHLDTMESFWTAETLKYYYLTFADPGLISLDDYVL